MNYGKSSQEKLETVDGKLQAVFREALKLDLIDITIVQGVRGEEEQNRYYLHGRSKVKWPEGKHNVEKEGDKAHAVDAVPYVNGIATWDTEQCTFLAGIVMAVAEKMGVKIRWGGCWSGDPADIGNQDFEDLAHFELVD